MFVRSTCAVKKKKNQLQHPEPGESKVIVKKEAASDSEFTGFKVGRSSARRSRRPLAGLTPIRRR